ncbi:hypothetical protein FQN55_008996 [Onygenales sp. PD_40]|nr:hypothetical protein FQN55_008996 [Onygenales sp. PD_40]
MADADIVYTGVSGPDHASGSLFGRTKFWLSKALPQRSWMRQRIENNGGKVVMLEKDADVLLVDYMKKGDHPPGSISYKYVEDSLSNGKLGNREDYRVGNRPGQVRPAGSSTIRQKTHRLPFSAKDDQILYDWVDNCKQKDAKLSGNKIYQQLEEQARKFRLLQMHMHITNTKFTQHPHHTWQSWRDRYVKTLRDRPRPVTAERHRSNSAVADRAANARPGDRTASPSRRVPPLNLSRRYEGFTREDKEKLLEVAKDILNLEPSKVDEAWEEWAKDVESDKTGAEWKSFFNDIVEPEYRAKKAEMRPSRRPPPAQHLETASTTSTNRSQETILSIRPERRERSREQRGSTSELTNEKRRRNTADIPSSDFQTDLLQRKKRRATEHVAQERISPSTPSEQSRRRSPISKSISSKDSSAQKSVHERNTLSKSNSPYPAQKSKSASVSRVPSTSTSTSASHDKFETAPQFQDTREEEDGETQYDTPVEPAHPSHKPHPTRTERTIPVSPPPAGEDNNNNHSQNAVQKIDSWITTRTTRTTGRNAISINQALEALNCTCMNFDLADAVLKRMKSNKDAIIPDDMRGVWTKQDDERLRSPDSRNIMRLLEKHGNDLFKERFGYLMTCQNAELDMGGEGQEGGAVQGKGREKGREAVLKKFGVVDV